MAKNDFKQLPIYKVPIYFERQKQVMTTVSIRLYSHGHQGAVASGHNGRPIKYS